MTAAEPEQVIGNCRHCGEVGPGKLVAYIDQASGPGWTVVVCAACEQNPPVVRPVERPRTYTL